MTNHNSSRDRDRAIIEADTAAFDADTFDPYEGDTIDHRAAELTEAGFAEWTSAFEICPVHHTDIQICADDELDNCEAGLGSFGDDSFDEADYA